MSCEPQAPLEHSIAAALKEMGYCLVRGAIDAGEVRRLEQDLDRAFEETPFCSGGFYGERTRRFGSLLRRSARTEQFVRHRDILAAAEEVLTPWCDSVQLNLTQGLALHPGALPQLPHRDQDMWRGVTGEVEYLVNVMWPFTPYTRDNGATLVWPGSHGRRALVADPQADPLAVEMVPGDALLFLGSTLHGAGGNRTGQVRKGMIVSYCLGWLKPYENQWLAYPPKIARHFSSELAGLVGYRQHRPNLGNYEGECPSRLLTGQDFIPTGARDALRPDQEDMVAAFVESQRAGR
ncbi:phytanoyl-CoA dioxygenase family protein [Novosphingobium naphthalenivorans]|uniref:phytanoyl-CoA dioxygenase family protein n=1 Tax=Novosphingobium naphthalenivorans TaxID=273168 RepID=UPI000834DED9|nr:phytanoyl-CoA dioxygenase family protein [Novosphingobium naphthalenivorans]